MSEKLKIYLVIRSLIRTFAATMKKILFIIGSLRAKSFNRQLANVAKEIIGDRAEVLELDYSDLPLLNQDIEQP